MVRAYWEIIQETHSYLYHCELRDFEIYQLRFDGEELRRRKVVEKEGELYFGAWYL